MKAKQTLLTTVLVVGVVMALTHAASYECRFSGCEHMPTDGNDDGQVNRFDIDSFVNLLATN